MSSTLIELHWLPSLEYFCALHHADKIILEKHEHYIKQSYRNRCHLLTVQGPLRMTLPLSAKHGKVMITDVRIDYSGRWQNNFWRTVESAYAKAPFYEHYADDLRKEIFAGHTYLYELNMRLLSLCLLWLKWSKPLVESADYEKNPSPEINDLRGHISAKTNFQHPEFYRPQPYQQVFGSNFVPNLSLIDLVFCEGPRAGAFVEASRPKN